MIPLTRRNAARGAALVSYTRQTLPRPARLYSTPTKKLNAPDAASTSRSPSLPEYPAYMPSSSSSSSEFPPPSSIHQEMHGFLRRPAPYTILPAPLPEDVAINTGDYIFPDTPTQDFVATIDACLHGLHDVPRAREIFERLRTSPQAEQVLPAPLFNTFLDAYLALAARAVPGRANWLEDAWALYDAMEGGRERAAPTANTYALMLQAWLRFGPDSPSPVELAAVPVHDPTALLRSIINRQIAPTLVVSDRAFTSDEEATQAIQALSRAAVHMGLSEVVSELGLAESLGKQVEDPLENVPEVVPVRKVDVSVAFRYLPQRRHGRHGSSSFRVSDSCLRNYRRSRLFKQRTGRSPGWCLRSP